MSPKLYRLKQLLEVVCLCKSTVYRLISLGLFPAPVKIGLRASAWRVEDVDAWLVSRETRSGEGV